MRLDTISECLTLPMYHQDIRIGTVDQMEILWEATKGKNGHPAMQWILEGFTQKVIIGVYQVQFVVLKLIQFKNRSQG